MSGLFSVSWEHFQHHLRYFIWVPWCYSRFSVLHWTQWKIVEYHRRSFFYCHIHFTGEVIVHREMISIAWRFKQVFITLVCVLSCSSCVWIGVTLWTVACQAPIFMGFSKHEYWSGFKIITVNTADILLSCDLMLPLYVCLYFSWLLRVPRMIFMCLLWYIVAFYNGFVTFSW